MDVSRKEKIALLMDRAGLRRAALASFLEPWARNQGIALLTVEPSEVSAEQGARLQCLIAVVHLGCISLRDYNSHNVIGLYQLIRNNHCCVVISDHTDADEAVVATQSGCRAFIQTSTDPSLVLQILSFVLGGGTYFPQMDFLHTPTADIQYRLQQRSTADAPLHLTRRQLEVLECLRHGRSNKLIGRDLDMRESTVKVHVRQIMRKLGVTNRTQAALLAGGTSEGHPASH